MNDALIERIQNNPKFKELLRKKSKLSWSLSIIMLAIYYGFILLVAFFPDVLAIPLSRGMVMTIGIPVGIFIIVIAFVLTGIYVRRANTEFDRLTHEIVEEARQ
ncbi:MAG: DUF485 domain-containing protein [Xanthomonadaceae bacterium]|jgi:uncharacterized membrane protein (DUF485 family)|nr:DUF485 domain-containing protein [Xanthomonadaceae bacterium]